MTFDREDGLRQQLCNTAVQLGERGLNRGASGNCSVRCGADFLITPSGRLPTDCPPEGMVRLSMAGEVIGAGVPSSEWRFHRDILAARPEVGAVIHTHSTHATALACLRQGIPPFHYMVALAGGDDIRCAPYALFGSQALSDGALTALQDRRACLLANHGVIAVGADLARALSLAVEVESLAEQYLLALNAGTPVLLNQDEMAAVMERFKTYGQGR